MSDDYPVEWMEYHYDDRDWDEWNADDERARLIDAGAWDES